MAMQNKVFVLSESSYQQATDFDVVMLYQVLLGRNPENSTVIQNHRLNPFNVTLQGFVHSPEFRESVLDPLGVGGQVRRHDQTSRPSPDQLAWLFSHALLDEAQKDAMRTAPDWESFFQFLCGLDGFLEQLAAPPPRPLRPAVPFKPQARALPRLPPDPATPAPDAAIAPAPPPGPTNAELMARLVSVEALLVDLLQRLPAALQSQPTAATPTAPGDAMTMDASEITAGRKPSSRRQAR